MKPESRDWEAYEIAERARLKRSFMALGSLTEAFDAATESAAHWNRMYREVMERERNDIREEKEAKSAIR